MADQEPIDIRPATIRVHYDIAGSVQIDVLDVPPGGTWSIHTDKATGWGQVKTIDSHHKTVTTVSYRLVYRVSSGEP